MKKLFVVVAVMAGICAIMPTVKAMSNATSVETSICIHSNEDPKVGDYIAVAGNAVGGHSIKISVYSYANSCYNYYALINGETYVVRDNPDYKKGSKNRKDQHTHYVQYKNDRYYFSI